MNVASHRSLKSAPKGALRRSLASCLVVGLAQGVTACGDGSDEVSLPPAFSRLDPPSDMGAAPSTSPVANEGAPQGTGAPNANGDQVNEGLSLTPTDGESMGGGDAPAAEEPTSDEPPVEDPPREEPADPEAPVLCTPLQNNGSTTDGDVNVILDTEFQTITGFGGVTMIPFFSGSTLTPGQVDIAFGRGAGQLGLSILRYPISDDPNDWGEELPAAQRAVELGAMVFATPWTPAPNLKSNGNRIGGFLLPQNYGAYATHLLAFRDFMAQNDVPIEAISVQNEPDIAVNYQSCDWTPQQISDFLVEQGARFGETRVIAAESFNFDVDMTDPILNNAQAVQQFDIVAGHLYGTPDGPFDYALARQRGKEVWMTEHYTDSGNEPDRANMWPLALDVGAEIHASMAANYNAYVWWYIRRGYGLILDNEQVSKRGWLFSQYSSFVRPGYVRVQASNPAGVQGVDVTAYKNGPGKVVVVALNQAAQSRTISLDVFGSCVRGFDRSTTSQTKNRQDDGGIALANGRVQVTLDAQSLTTFVSQDATPSLRMRRKNSSMVRAASGANRAGPRILVVLDSAAGWSRGILRGFASIAHEQGWVLLHYPPTANLEQLACEVNLQRLAVEMPPRAVVLGPMFSGRWPSALRECVSVAVNADRSAEGIASVCLDESRIADLAVSHLLGRGFRNLTTFGFDASFGSWAERRDQRFCETAARLGAQLEPSCWAGRAPPQRKAEHPADVVQWLAQLRTPCGIFALCDVWARMLARCAQAANLRVPEDVALVGVDNDLLECEMAAPPLTSVAVPWLSVGESAARLVQLGLQGKPIAGQQVLVSPIDVVVRRSSDTFAINDPLVAEAVAWIHAHVGDRLTVPTIVRSVGATRQRLERHFRRELGRTVQEEVRRARVEVARRLLSTTGLPLNEVASRSGFTNAALLSVAFRRETGVPPGAFRRHAQALVDGDD